MFSSSVGINAMIMAQSGVLQCSSLLIVGTEAWGLKAVLRIGAGSKQANDVETSRVSFDQKTNTDKFIRRWFSGAFEEEI